MFDAVEARNAGFAPEEIEILELAFLVALDRLGRELEESGVKRLSWIVCRVGIEEAALMGALTDKKTVATIATRALKLFNNDLER